MATKLSKSVIKNAVECAMSGMDFAIKPKQLEAVINVIKGKDTLCIFPAAFGKSLIFQLLPHVSSTLKMYLQPIVIVISPLLSLIEDHVVSCNNLKCLNLSAVKLEAQNSLTISAVESLMLFLAHLRLG